MSAADDERIVTDLLKAIDGEAGSLRPALLELRSLAHGPVPVPSPELADLLVGSAVVSLVPRRRARRRAAIFSLAVVTAMGVGTTAAAAMSPEFRTATQHVITGIVGGLTPGATSSVTQTPTPEPSTANAPVRSTTTHPAPHSTPTDSLPPQTPGQRSSPGHPDPLVPVKQVPPVLPSQKDHIPGVPPTPGRPSTPQKSWTDGMIPGISDGVPGAK
jgi:hypothetical protein